MKRGVWLGHLDNILHVVASGLHHHVQNVPRVVREEDAHHHECPAPESDLGERLDALVQAGEDGDAREDGDQADDDGLCVTLLVSVSQPRRVALGRAVKAPNYPGLVDPIFPTAASHAVARDVPDVSRLGAMILRLAADVDDELET